MPRHQRGDRGEAGQKGRAESDTQHPTFVGVLSVMMDFFVKMFSGDLRIFHIVRYQIAQRNRADNRSRGFRIKGEDYSTAV